MILMLQVSLNKSLWFLVVNSQSDTFAYFLPFETISVAPCLSLKDSVSNNPSSIAISADPLF